MEKELKLKIDKVSNPIEPQKRAKREKFDSDRKFTWAKLGQFMKIVLFNAKEHPILFTIMVIVTIADATMATLLPLVASQMTELLLSHTTNEFIGLVMHWYSWIYVAVVILAAMIFFEYLADYTIGVFSMCVEVQQRKLILKRLVNQDLDFFFENVSGDIMTRLVGDTQGLSVGIQQFLTNIIYCLTAIVSSAIILFNKNTMMTGIALGYVVLALAIGFILFFYFRRSLIKMFDFKRVIDADMTDRLNNITLIKSSGQEVQEIKRAKAKNAIYNRKGNSTVELSVIMNAWIYIANSFLPTIMILIGIAVYDNTADLVSVLTAFIPSVSMMSLPVIMMIQTLRAAARASNCADRIGQLTLPEPTILPNENGQIIKKIDDIIFDKVSFAYPQDLSNVIIPASSFKFEKGKSYAFVGETGSGKSTIAKLLLRLYDPTTGKILINDKYDLKDVNLSSYLSRVGYVEQNPQIFYGNFWENISYGMFDATKEEIMEAAKKANLHDFIMSLPEKYETILGERGFLLSGGQKQRLVIARVFLKDPDLVILDEATSALDNIVEKEIQAELDKLVVGKTSVTIAHRLSTIENVDRIVVIEPKKGITQIGTFDELKSQPGHFKKLYEAGLMD